MMALIGISFAVISFAVLFCCFGLFLAMGVGGFFLWRWQATKKTSQGFEVEPGKTESSEKKDV